MQDGSSQYFWTVETASLIGHGGMVCRTSTRESIDTNMDILTMTHALQLNGQALSNRPQLWFEDFLRLVLPNSASGGPCTNFKPDNEDKAESVAALDRGTIWQQTVARLRRLAQGARVGTEP